MTLARLIDTLTEMVHLNPKRAFLKVYFDTEARTYKYHQAEIGSAYCEDGPHMQGFECVTLHEVRPPSDPGQEG